MKRGEIVIYQTQEGNFNRCERKMKLCVWLNLNK